MGGLLLYDIHGKTFSGPSSESNLLSGSLYLNQQQLQTARTALWRQTGGAAAGALVTFDDVVRWLDEIGLCLFLPRHAQLPAPAPSFVEVSIGSASAVPPPAAITKAMELAVRLIGAGDVVPLNLLGTHSEQPDFLVTPEVLPWVAAIRGDRHWKTAPGGRTAPIVMRTWEALEQSGPHTALELREMLGRELTEAAVLRALIELWTTLRVIPVPAAGEVTRWHLLKERYPAQLARGGNTAQATALSALISLYLRSAVAATAEEAEVFLSPLTARSRIREVLHGLMATGQLGTMSVSSQTLLFVEGSLPEVAPVAEQAEVPAAPALQKKLPQRVPRDQWQRPKFPQRRGGEDRKERYHDRADRDLANRGREAGFRPQRREFRPAVREGAQGEADKGLGKKREWQPREGGGKFVGKGKFAGRREEGGERRDRPQDRRPEDRREGKSWQKRSGGKFGQRGKFEQRKGGSSFRPPFRKPPREGEKQGEERGERPRFGPRFGKGPRPPFGAKGRPQRREEGQDNRPRRPGEERENRPQRPYGKRGAQPYGKPGKKFEGRQRFGRPSSGAGRNERGRREEGRGPDRGPGASRGAGRGTSRGTGPDRGQGRSPGTGQGRSPGTGRGGRPFFRPGKKPGGKFNPSLRAAKPNPRKNRKENPRREEESE